MRRRAILALAVLAMAGSAARADDVVVRVENFTFNPAEITVRPGTTVRWLNGDDIPHSIVAAGASFHSKPFDTDETYATTLTQAGEINYLCGLHPHMKGKIIVKP
jgi:plastocyanin